MADARTAPQGLARFFSGDGGRRPVYRLEQGDVSRMNISRGRKAESPGKLCAKIAKDVAEEITGYDDAKLSGIANDLHHERVDVQMARLDARIFILYLRKNAQPEFVPVGERIGFVAHADAAEFMFTGVLESVANDSLHSPAGIDVFLHGDLVRGAALKLSSHANVEAFGILAEHDKVDIACGPAIAQRGQRRIDEFDRAKVHVEVELGAQAEQMSAACILEGTRGSPTAPNRTASKSRRSIGAHRAAAWCRRGGSARHPNRIP